MQGVLRPRGRGDDDIATMEKDLLLNVLVILLLLVGGGAGLLADARAPESGSQTVPTQAVKIYIRDDGELHFGLLCSPHVTVEEIEWQVRAAAGIKTVGGPLAVLIHHTDKTPAGFVHAVLRVVGRVPGTESLLALSRYAALPCEGQEEKEQRR